MQIFAKGMLNSGSLSKERKKGLSWLVFCLKRTTLAVVSLTH